MKLFTLSLLCIVVPPTFSILSHREPLHHHPSNHHRTHHRALATISPSTSTDVPVTHLVLGSNATPIQTPWSITKDNDPAHAPLKIPSNKSEAQGELIAFCVLFGSITIIVLMSLGWTIWRWHWRGFVRRPVAEDSDISIPILIEQPEGWRSIPSLPVMCAAVEWVEPSTITRYPSWHKISSSGFGVSSFCSEDGVLQLHSRQTYRSRKTSRETSSVPSLVERSQSKLPTVQSVLPTWPTETILRSPSISMPRLPPLARPTLLASYPLVSVSHHSFSSEAGGSSYAGEDSDDLEMTSDRMYIRRVIPADEDKTGIGTYRRNKSFA